VGQELAPAVPGLDEAVHRRGEQRAQPHRGAELGEAAQDERLALADGLDEHVLLGREVEVESPA